MSAHGLGPALVRGAGPAGVEAAPAQERDERLSVRQLADDSGMSSSRVTATLTGRRVPNRDELDLLCAGRACRSN
ncbi:helix-turn-helix transcriptional regulator [Streptomyces sp. MBT65]|uniref:helix-turn-helix domain-containing protein n=1 Tax=Streptomyces sp. MBT65 TaxID=1488395 RepID=UPI00190AD840|nr:helix-turn-helix transcriptional regulator [Streptomyces sp. MBT65]MBK3576512.1 helix-turn-helix transcriptional regulator [Streptomyces sp. MBT65]